MRKKVKDIIIITGITAVLLLLVEFASFLILKKKGYDVSFLIQLKGNDNVYDINVPAHASWQLNAFDPTMGYAHDYLELDKKLSTAGKKIIPGFVKYGDESGDSTQVRVVVLGGSTSDGTLMPYSWPEDLYQIMKDNRYNSVVYNGGVGGFSSSQELLKLIRDVIQLKPDIVISLDGINDISCIHSIQDYPYINPYQQFVFEYLAGKVETPAPIMSSTFR